MLAVIFEALEQRLNYDMRENMSKPLFMSGKTSMENLAEGDIVTGAVGVTTLTHCLTECLLR